MMDKQDRLPEVEAMFETIEVVNERIERLTENGFQGEADLMTALRTAWFIGGRRGFVATWEAIRKGYPDLKLPVLFGLEA